MAAEWGAPASGPAFTVQFQDTLQDGIWRAPATAMPFPVASNQWLDPVTTNVARLYRVVAVSPAERGKVLSVAYSNTLSVATLAFLFNDAQIPITPLYDVALYKVDYETISPLGGRTQASGALALPLNSGQLLPLVSYQHGTITLTNDAPSSMDLTGEVTVGIGFASTGYAAAVPDYLGLGDSPGLHPYHHANSEATACVDMLRAVRTFCATNGFALTNLLFLCGYSEGGHATMALLREAGDLPRRRVYRDRLRPYGGGLRFFPAPPSTISSTAAQPRTPITSFTSWGPIRTSTNSRPA